MLYGLLKLESLYLVCIKDIFNYKLLSILVRRFVVVEKAPYNISMNVATNVGQEFLKLIDEHFPPGHILRSVMNRTTIKVSYRCLPNMGAQIAKHNAKIL